MSQAAPKSVAIITSTIGRAELVRAIESVQAQTYPATHYIFVDGEQFAEKAREVVQRYPHLIVTYLPMNTGAKGWTNSAINAIAPFLVKEEIICYLDDDNWYEPTHIKNCVARFEETQADYVYALRNFYTPEQQFICRDFIESLGFYENRIEYPLTFHTTYQEQTFGFLHQFNKAQHIDTNCYAMTKQTALNATTAWYSGKQNDTNVFYRLMELQLKGACSHTFSVNYTVDVEKMDPEMMRLFSSFNLPAEVAKESFYQILQYSSELNRTYYGGKYPWESH